MSAVEAYFKKLWKEKWFFILILAGLVIYYGLRFRENGWAAGEIGVGIGCLVAIALLWAPISFIEMRKIKVRNAKPVFVEPTMPVLLFWAGLGSIGVAALFTALFTFTPLGQFLENQGDTVGAMALLMFTLCMILFWPFALYSAYIKTHYKKIIQYDTLTWRKIRKSSK